MDSIKIRILNKDDYSQYFDLINICVDNNYRGKNYGKILMNHLIDEAKKENCYKVTLYCKEDLSKFYKSCNMEKNGVQMAIYF